MALAWMGATMAFASVVRKPKRLALAFDRNALWGEQDPVLGVTRITAERLDLA
jgi:hypothetical protein